MVNNIDNLKPIKELSSEEAKQRGSKGGIKSGQVRRKKKMMSQIYADYLIKRHKITGKDGVSKSISGQELLNDVMTKVLSRGDSSSVSLMKEIREGTEGQKITVNNAEVEKAAEELNKLFKEKFGEG